MLPGAGRRIEPAVLACTCAQLEVVPPHELAQIFSLRPAR